MSNANPYKPPHSVDQRNKAAWKAYLILNLVLVMIPVIFAAGIYVWLILEAWQATRDNNGDPVTYQHFFFWVAPSGYLLITLYLIVPNWLLFIHRR